MAKCVEIRWSVTPFRSDEFVEKWTPYAAAAIDFGAAGYALFRSLEDSQHVTQYAFFEDKDDKKLLVGLVLPGSSAEIRLYYVNNDTWEPADRYFEAYQRAAGAQFKNLKSEKVKAGKLEWFKMAYSDEGGTDVNVSGELGGLGLRKVSTPEQEKDRKEKRQKKGPRNVIRFLLVQIDGVVDIECSASQGEARQLEEMFGKVNESFTLSFTRRW